MSHDQGIPPIPDKKVIAPPFPLVTEGAASAREIRRINAINDAELSRWCAEQGYPLPFQRSSSMGLLGIGCAIRPASELGTIPKDIIPVIIGWLRLIGWCGLAYIIWSLIS